MSTYAAVIPAYNEAATIRQVVSSVLAHIPLVIVVDDGSSDGTAAALSGLPITLLCNDSNEGKAASLWRGVHAALERGVHGVITLDGDGQHLPEAIPRLIAAAQEHPGRIVIGARVVRDLSQVPLRRYYANKIANFWISWACGQSIADTQSGYRLYPVEVFAHLNIPHDRPHSFVFESEVLIEAARLGFSTWVVPVPAVYKRNGRLSHFKQIDSLRISAMVARRLFSRALYLPGLWDAFIRPKDPGGRLD